MGRGGRYDVGDWAPRMQRANRKKRERKNSVSGAGCCWLSDGGDSGLRQRACGNGGSNMSASPHSARNLLVLRAMVVEKGRALDERGEDLVPARVELWIRHNNTGRSASEHDTSTLRARTRRMNSVTATAFRHNRPRPADLGVRSGSTRRCSKGATCDGGGGGSGWCRSRCLRSWLRAP